MNGLFHYIKRGTPIQYGNLIAVTPVPGLKFTNWYEQKSSFFFWHMVLGLGFLLTLAVNFKFWYQYQFLNFLPAFAELEPGVKLAFPSVYLCPRHPLNPNKLAKYRKDFLQTNFTMSSEAIDSSLQHMFRAQRTAFNVSNEMFDGLEDNLDMLWLEKNSDKLFYAVDDQFKECSFQGLRRECKDIFKSVETSLGHCFVFNSIFTDNTLHEDPHQIWYANISESDDDWSLRFKIFRDAGTFIAIYFKYPKDLLALNDFPAYTWHPTKQTADYYFSITEYFCEEILEKLGYRRCNEAFEPQLRAEFNTNLYAAGVCFNYCHARKFLELCGCWPSFAKNIFPKMASKSRICGVKDMKCYENSYLAVRQMKCSHCLNHFSWDFYSFNDYNHDFSAGITAQANKGVTLGTRSQEDESDTFEMQLNHAESVASTFYLPRRCLLSFNMFRKFHFSQEVNVYYPPSWNSSLEVDYAELSILLDHWPRVYFHIINLFHTTEFILALASTTCLFLGTSILTFMEAFYNLLIRFPLFYIVNREYFIKAVRRQEELQRRKPFPYINLRLKPALHPNLYPN